MASHCLSQYPKLSEGGKESDLCITSQYLHFRHVNLQ